MPAHLAAARARTIERLTECFARDQLPMEEFESRLTAAYDAATIDALDALTADLPGAAAGQSPAPAAPLRIAAVLSNVERGGILSVPAHLEIRTLAGNVELDLRDADFAPGVTEIALHNLVGNIEIQLPAGVRVENQATSFLGSFECRMPRRSGDSAGPTATVVRLTGRTVLGSVTVTVS